MTEDGVFNRLQALLSRVDAEAAILDPAHVRLSHVIRAHQNGPRPVGPYASLNMLADDDLGEVHCLTYADREIGEEERVVQTVARAHAWLVRIEVYASAPTDYLRLFAAALHGAAHAIDLAPLVVRRVRDITRAPELVQERWEGRAFLDVELGGIAANGLLIDVIESGTIQANGGSVFTAIRTYSQT